jgi:hypothetical protein
MEDEKTIEFKLKEIIDINNNSDSKSPLQSLSFFSEKSSPN